MQKPKTDQTYDHQYPWHQDVQSRSEEYYKAHLTDGKRPDPTGSALFFPGHAKHGVLAALAVKLFSNPSNGFLELTQLQDLLHNTYTISPPPGTAADLEKINAFVRVATGGGELSHAQCMTLYYILVEQENVQLLSPVDPASRVW